MNRLVPTLLALVMTISISVSIATKAEARYADIDSCLNTVRTEFQEQARTQGGALMDHTLRVSEIDDRWYNPSKYVWFEATAQKPDGTRFKIEDMKQVNSRVANSCKKPATVAPVKEAAFIAECRPVAIRRLEAEFREQNATINRSSIKIEQIDNHAWNPKKFVWFGADGVAPDGRAVHLIVMLEKSYLPPRPCGQLAETASPNESASASAPARAGSAQ